MSLVVGIDEAGRGPLAGPVVVAAVCFKKELISGVADSKKLSKKKRESLFDAIKEGSHFSIQIISSTRIDEINILAATLEGMKLCAEDLARQLGLVEVLIDGNKLPDFSNSQGILRAEAIVKGDSKIAEISAASILAKVTRDRLMDELAKEFPQYGFDKHSGYGTKAHMAAISLHGPCEHHRKSFEPIASMVGFKR